MIDATAYQDLVPGRNGEVFDVGAPVRADAIRALDDMDALGDDVLARSLSDNFEWVVLAAVEASARRRDTALLARAVASQPEGSQAYRRAVEALFELRAAGGTRGLAEALIRRGGDRPLSSGEGAMVPALLEAEAREDARHDLIEALVSALSEPREPVRGRADDLLTRLAPSSVDPLVAELKSGPAPHAAAHTLGAIKDRRAVDPLIAALEHADARVRAASCQALGELRDPIAVEALMRATRDPEHTVRAHAGVALDQLGTVAVAVGVSAMLRPMLAELRESIGESGPSAPAVGSGHEHSPLGNGFLLPRTSDPGSGVPEGHSPAAGNGPSRSAGPGLVRRAIARIERTARPGGRPPRAGS